MTIELKNAAESSLRTLSFETFDDEIVAKEAEWVRCGLRCHATLLTVSAS